MHFVLNRFTLLSENFTSGFRRRVAAGWSEIPHMRRRHEKEVNLLTKVTTISKTKQSCGRDEEKQQQSTKETQGWEDERVGVWSKGTDILNTCEQSVSEQREGKGTTLCAFLTPFPGFVPAQPSVSDVAFSSHGLRGDGSHVCCSCSSVW